ncbi:hypothetical protein [Streptomyces sp. LN500]
MDARYVPTLVTIPPDVDESGVLAVVVSGLIMSQTAPRVVRAEARRQAMAFWPMATFVINGALFVLV